MQRLMKNWRMLIEAAQKEEKILIDKQALDRILAEYEAQLALDESTDADCNRRGFYHFQHWLKVQSMISDSTKGKLTPDYKQKKP